ncbi:hypothetical protein CANARDRAFT_54348 [[Candida] arabinofermentans NRRL YB-2248]|uniref:Uncharacterized protein n=1 Tax=[Candida] arabinofermentans NRRL YB-2248 TaxID=983967 RepID=A0A1E4T8A6_9ASCO|nr:hypothetical protein CANARDRAFT_54348 [[Candida] arabinofermentans NRRL YB-2248]
MCSSYNNIHLDLTTLNLSKLDPSLNNNIELLLSNAKKLDSLYSVSTSSSKVRSIRESTLKVCIKQKSIIQQFCLPTRDVKKIRHSKSDIQSLDDQTSYLKTAVYKEHMSSWPTVEKMQSWIV